MYIGLRMCEGEPNVLGWRSSEIQDTQERRRQWEPPTQYSSAFSMLLIV